ncbi:sushi domain-containing protein 6 isoform X2 [Alosa sapidissima]|uniref:sushi domain-containing protein 6 isoform X2 n=1 Tax=Alosa sapidissima TaxID=34773 RepID=UPI001C080F89|nr:sushi domain-containing protein 6 isoform X2 [Alosa sapidissima]
MSGGMVAVPSPLAPRSVSPRLAVPVVLLLATLTRAHASGCPRPSGVQHGWVNLTETNRGSVPVGTLLQYSCYPGYMLDGPSIITCAASGHWSYEPPLCIRTDGCPRPSGVQHGWVNLTETNRGSVPVGTVLQYSCDPGYMLDGPSVVTCAASGHWSYQPPLCIRTDDCQPPSEPENGGYTCHPSPCHRLTQGTVIEYFCDEGFALKGEYNYRTCQNGEWDSAMQVSCHQSQGKDEHSPLAMPALSIVASTASSVALILLLVVLFVLLQPKLKSLHHSRREQGVSGQPSSIVVEGVQVSLPSYEEAVYGSSGVATAASSSSSAPQESRVQIVLSEGPQSDGGSQADCRLLPCTSSSSSSASSSRSLRHAETVLVHPAPSCSSSSSPSPYSPPSPCSWAAEQPSSSGASAAAGPLPHDSESSDQHSLLSLTSSEDFADDIPLLKEA